MEPEKSGRTGGDRLQPTLEFRERALGVAHQRLTFRAETHASADAFKQHNPKSLLHFSDGMTDSTGGQIYFRRRRLKRTPARCSFEYAQRREGHREWHRED